MNFMRSQITGLVVFILAALTAQEGLCAPLVMDCEATDCPELLIKADAPAEITRGRPSPFRGYADGE